MNISESEDAKLNRFYFDEDVEPKPKLVFERTGVISLEDNEESAWAIKLVLKWRLDLVEKCAKEKNS